MPAKFHVWEEIGRTDHTRDRRMKVPGGWIYLHVYPGDDADCRIMVFVPDPMAADPRT